ncbi:glycosyltransferase family 2 protein [Butyribacter sp.]|uniref:glycosyltransferase family 2 protein n=1 Tax=Butyribacter sp. TaxID=2822465 RepID=UPI002A931680|nr:glycosyltransferase family 2 protein [Butyribacter sp.]
MKDDVLISVIIPVYKVEQYLDNCVKSIINQEYKNLDIVLVDDGSPDNCPAMCDGYAKEDKRIRVIHKKNGGLTSAWMAGLDSVGDDVKYVTFVDSDDWIPKNYIGDFVAKAEEFGVDVVLGNTTKFYKDEYVKYTSGHVGYYDKQRLRNEIYPEILFDGNFHGRSVPVCRWGKLYKKDIIKRNVCYCDSKTTYSEDLNITFPVMLDAESVYFLPPNEGNYQYRLNPNSMVHAYDKNMYNSIQHVHPALIKACQDKKYESIIMQVYADFLAACVQYYKNELQNPKGFQQTLHNIELITKNEMLLYAIANIEWKHFRKLNVIIIRCLSNFRMFSKYLVTPLLYVLKRSGIRKPS